MSVTDRDVFETVRAHLLGQGRQALGEGGCRYRAPDGARCAIGCLIAPDAYSPDLEGQGIYSEGLRHSLRSSGIELDARPSLSALLTALQSCHDARKPVDWRRILEEIAWEFADDGAYTGSPLGWCPD